ncbi:G-protein coupled receptor GRL101-like [Anneissia japonica]|uniref:G-protein coupled receptor GRL101-like n=1 Tax=Anneissia japonica TaxID=1529436 RepID=UPI0014256AC3|nr:G-protein coupled receptor GRL101-like [Anneissia japonica]
MAEVELETDEETANFSIELDTDGCNTSLIDRFLIQLTFNNKYNYTAILAYISCILSIALNVSIFVIVVSDKTLRKKGNNVFTGSLALSDSFFSVAVIVLVSICRAEREMMFLYTFTVCLTFAGISIQTIGVVAIERLLVVVIFPFKRNINTPKKMLFVCFCIWGFSISFACALLITHKEDEFGFIMSIWDVVIFVNVYVSYAVIYLVVKNHDKKVSKFRTQEFNTSKKLLKTFSIIIFTCTVCWMPIITLTVLDYFDKLDCNKTIYPHIFNISFILALAYSIANPIVYGLRINELRNAIDERFISLRNFTIAQ